MFNTFQRDVRTSEVIMLDRIMVSDLQKEILEMQIDISAMANVSKLSPTSFNNNYALEESTEPNKAPPIDLFDSLKADYHKADYHKANFVKPNTTNEHCGRSQENSIKSEVKGESDLIPTTVEEFTSNHKLQQTANACVDNINEYPMAGNICLDDSKALIKFDSKETANLLMESHKNDSKYCDSSYDVKKEIEGLDIESEITPSYIIKKTDQMNRASSPPELNLDYLCGPVGSDPSNDRRKEELISSEPYDEWLCIQKELNLITEKRDSYASSPSGSNMSAKMSVESQLHELFNHSHRSSDDMTDKSDIANMVHSAASPLSELFNDTMVSNSIDNVTIDKTLENRLENMFNDSNEFGKTNDLVESRLEELFHGATSPSSLATQMAAADSHHHIHNQQMHNNVDVIMQNAGQLISHHNKRQWQSNGSLLSPNSVSCMQSSNKRSCMVSSYMDTSTAATVEQQWMMDCPPPAYDFISSDSSSDNSANKQLWNGASNDVSANGSNANDPMIMNQMDMKKSVYSNALKNHDLERDLLGLSTESSPIPLDNTSSVLLNHHHHPHNYHHHMHNDTSYETPTTTTNTSNNSLTSNFDDDINRHVQNAIDSILNLQNSESDTLEYSLDQSMSSFMVDTTGNMSLTYSSNTNRSQLPHQLHTPSHYQNNTPMHKRRMNHFDDTSDCLISGGRSMDDSHVDMLIDSPPIMQQTNDMVNMSSSTSNVPDFIGIDDSVKSIITS